MRREFFIPLVLGIVAFGVVFWSPQAGWFVRSIIVRETGDMNGLAVENQALRGEVESLQYLRDTLHTVPGTYLPAMVYAQYPGSTKSELLVAAGELQGVSVGQPVVILPSGAGTSTSGRTPILIGKIAQVSRESAVVSTIFDAEWKSAVRVGTANRNALLVGGGSPMLTLIERKTASIKEGDIVRNASPDFPYGLVIGEAMNVGFSEDRLYEEALVRFSYSLNELRTVYIDTAFQGVREEQ